MTAGYSGTTLARKLGIKPGVCAVDATWSGLKFVYRLKDRSRQGLIRT